MLPDGVELSVLVASFFAHCLFIYRLQVRVAPLVARLNYWRRVPTPGNWARRRSLSYTVSISSRRHLNLQKTRHAGQF